MSDIQESQGLLAKVDGRPELERWVKCHCLLLSDLGPNVRCRNPGYHSRADRYTQHEGEQGMMVHTLLAAQKGGPALGLVAKSLYSSDLASASASSCTSSRLERN